MLVTFKAVPVGDVIEQLRDDRQHAELVLEHADDLADRDLRDGGELDVGDRLPDRGRECERANHCDGQQVSFHGVFLWLSSRS